MTCGDGGSCTTCADGFVKGSMLCYQCEEGQFLDVQTDSCKACGSLCKSCGADGKICL